MEETKIIYLSPQDVADYLKMSLDTVYRYMQRTENPMPSYKFSTKNIRVRLDELDKWVETYMKEEVV